MAHCALPSRPSAARICHFYIFEHVLAPIILGRKFLHDAGISRCPTRSGAPAELDDDCDGQSIWTTRSLDQVETYGWQVMATLSSGYSTMDVAIVCDGGSNVNLMSLVYAEGIRSERKILPGNLSNSAYIRLAYCRITGALGICYVSIQFHGRASQFGFIPVAFILVADLPFPIAIGASFIQRYRIFEDLRLFDWKITNDDQPMLCAHRWCEDASKLVQHPRPMNAGSASGPIMFEAAAIPDSV